MFRKPWKAEQKLATRISHKIPCGGMNKGPQKRVLIFSPRFCTFRFMSYTGTDMFKKINYFFDKLEDRVRHTLSKQPVVYAFIGGVSIVLFWRGVWHIADEFGMTSWESLIVSVILMMLTGTFVSFFIGEQILISGLKEEKRIDQRTEADLQAEDDRIRRLAIEINEIQKDVKEIKEHLISVPIKRVTKTKR